MIPQNNFWKLSSPVSDSLPFMPHYVKAQDEVPALFCHASAKEYQRIIQTTSGDSICGSMFVTGTHEPQPRKIEKSSLHADWILPVLMVLSVIMTVAVSLSYRKLAALIKASYSRRHFVIFQKNYNLFSDPATFMLIFVHALSIALFAILFLDQLKWGQFELNFGFFALLAGGLILLRVVKAIIANAIALIFETRENTKQYIENNYIYDIASVFLLLPLSWVLMYSPFTAHILFASLVMLLIINVYRFFMSFYTGILNTGFSFFYFILYLCTVELMPLLLLVKFLNESNI